MFTFILCYSINQFWSGRKEEVVLAKDMQPVGRTSLSQIDILSHVLGQTKWGSDWVIL